MDHRILIGFPNRLDGATVSGGQWLADAPLANIKSRQIAKVARSDGTSPSAATFTLDLLQPRPIRLFCLVNHNISLTATARYEISESPSFPPDERTFYSEIADVWGGFLDAPWDIDKLEWEDDNFWLGGFTPEEIEGFTAVSTHILPEPRSGRYLRVTIFDEGNPDGFIQIGRVFAGPTISPRINYAWNAVQGYRTSTAIQTALGGAEFFDIREPIRVFRFKLDHMQTDEAYGTFLEMVRRVGVHGEIFIIPDPSDAYNGLRRNFLGRLEQPSLLEIVQWENAGPAHSMAFETKELR